MNKIDDTKEFLKGAMLAYVQTHTPEEVSELYDLVFTYITRTEAADICLAITAKFFDIYDR